MMFLLVLKLCLGSACTQSPDATFHTEVVCQSYGRFASDLLVQQQRGGLMDKALVLTFTCEKQSEKGVS